MHTDILRNDIFFGKTNLMKNVGCCGWENLHLARKSGAITSHVLASAGLEPLDVFIYH